MLGVIIGVASVVALVGVGQGTTANITSRLAGLGTNLLTVSPTGRGGTTSTNLTLDDATAIGELALDRRASRRRSRRAQTIKAGDRERDRPRSSGRPARTRRSAPTTSGRARS